MVDINLLEACLNPISEPAWTLLSSGEVQACLIISMNNSGGGYQQGPPPPQQYQQGYNSGYGAPPQPMYQGQQSFPQPYAAPPVHSNYQNYQSGAPPSSYSNNGGAPNPYQQPMMHYAAPGQGPPQGQVGPSQYQGGQFQVHSQPVNNAHLYSNCSGNRTSCVKRFSNSSAL